MPCHHFFYSWKTHTHTHHRTIFKGRKVTALVELTSTYVAEHGKSIMHVFALLLSASIIRFYYPLLLSASIIRFYYPLLLSASIIRLYYPLLLSDSIIRFYYPLLLSASIIRFYYPLLYKSIWLNKVHIFTSTIPAKFIVEVELYSRVD